GCMGAQRRALAAGESRARDLDLLPAGLPVLVDEHAFRRFDPLERAVADPHGAPRRDGAAARAPAELLLVLVALLVAVEDAADRRVPPVDDADARLDARRAAEAEIALLAVRLEPHVREVGRARVHFRRLGRAAQLAQQRALPVPLLGQRHGVL